jgi:phasin family protein
MLRRSIFCLKRPFKLTMLHRSIKQEVAMANADKADKPKGHRPARAMPRRGSTRLQKPAETVAITAAVIEPVLPPVAAVVTSKNVEGAAVEWPIAKPASVSPSKKSTQPAASLAAGSPQKGVIIMTDVIESTKAFAEDAKVRIQSVVADLNEKAKVAVEKSSKAMEEMTELTKGNLEAMVESSKIAAKGVEAMGQNAAEYGRKSFEKTSATFKSFAGVKSPTEFFQLQSELMTSAFDTMAAEAAKTSESMLKLAGEIAQPISNRVAVVSDKIKTLAA